jgi:colanic acid/amylovoran biosynthesis glycosyltransferase
MARRPSVVLETFSFPKLSETFIVNKFVGLLDRGLDVYVASRESRPAEWLHFPHSGRRPEVRGRVRVTRRGRPRWLVAPAAVAALLRCLVARPRATARYLSGGWRRFGARAIGRLYLDASLVRLGPDVLHFEFGTAAVGRMYLKDLLGCKVVVSFRGYDLNFVGLDDPHYYREVWERADALHFLGNDLLRRAIGRGCPDDKPRVVIPPGIDTALFDPGARAHVDRAGTPARPLRIVCVGRLVWKKGYEYALEAVRLLLDRGVACELRIVGGGEYHEAVAFAVRHFGLEGTASMLGELPQTGVRSHLLWSDAFLHTAVSEGYCNAVAEAQAMSLPVVCSDADGLPENVSDGVTGFVVPRRDPGAVAEKLALLAADPALRQRLGAAGRERVLARYRLADQITAFEGLYRTLAREGAATSGGPER